MKIHLAGAYNLADGYLGGAMALQRLGWKVTFSPMMEYSHKDRSSHVERIISDIKKEDPDIVLWWRAETLSGEEFAIVRKSVPGVFALFNWDPMSIWEENSSYIGDKCKYLDLVFTCCRPSMKMYEAHGCKSVHYAGPGFDQNIHRPEMDKDFECDISMILTNLYHGDAITKYPHISRKDLLDTIVRLLPEVNLKIYGPEWLGTLYPARYAGWAKFTESRKIYHNSKINLCTHLRPDTDGYYNERVAQVLGSEGLLLVDPVVGLDKIIVPGRDCLFMDFSSPENFAKQIRVILSCSDKLAGVRRAGRERAMKVLTWDFWACRLDAEIKNMLHRK